MLSTPTIATKEAGNISLNKNGAVYLTRRNAVGNPNLGEDAEMNPPQLKILN
jgi:hypothetical protein